MSIPPSDPTLYRLFEMIQVYGYPIKAIIHEKVYMFSNDAFNHIHAVLVW